MQGNNQAPGTKHCMSDLPRLAVLVQTRVRFVFKTILNAFYSTVTVHNVALSLKYPLQMVRLKEDFQRVGNEKDLLMAENTKCSPENTEELKRLQANVASLTEERDQLLDVLREMTEEKNQLSSDLDKKEEMVR